ncbi:hypothetical protein [Yeosuana aromativorans]|uniref:hypothetical protein n=1 Tax=Yeosuana aromativorans TaxID=288019 RepID=UPI0016691143|nr:hypothetical protein [Yeosuana aromativorans]
MRNSIFFLFFLFFCASSSIFSQTTFTDVNKKYYLFYDSLLVNENNNIFNGPEYIDIHKSISKEDHKFYKSYDFHKGLVVYNGQPYFDIKMKYDLLNDLLIIQFDNKNFKYISLNSSLISEFEIDNNRFVRLKNNTILEPYYKNGFFEVAYQNKEYSLYTKYKKVEKKKIINKSIYYTFKEHSVHFLNFKNKLNLIDSKKDLLKAIPGRESEVKTFFSSYSKLFKKNKQQFLIKLLGNLSANQQ